MTTAADTDALYSGIPDLGAITDRIAAERPDLPPPALRALAEAEHRRLTAPALDLPEELGGRDGPEPVRFGDYERKGLCVDF